MAQNWHFCQFGPGHAGFFGALLVGGWWLWRAGCILQETYLLYLYQPDLLILHVDFAAWSMRVLVGTPYQLSLENDIDSRNVFKNPAKAIFLH